jgi:hypothetical protein
MLMSGLHQAGCSEMATATEYLERELAFVQYSLLGCADWSRRLGRDARCGKVTAL